MRSGKALLISASALLIVLLAAQGFAQAPAPSTRIPHQVVINGQRQNGVYVTAPGGGLQSFTCDNPQQFVTPDGCDNPQQFVTPDGATQGWACYEQATGTWLLNALPPAQAQAAPAPVPAPAQPPAVVYQAPPTVYQAPPTVYQAPPVIVYQTPPVYYTYGYPRPVYVAPAYRPSVVLGVAAINAAGRIAAAAVRPYPYGRVYYGGPVHVVRGGHGRRW
jgi:hypothetical protein